MDLVKEYKRNTAFKNDNDLYASLIDIFKFGTIKSEYKDLVTIENKEEINQVFVSFLNTLLSTNLVTNRKDKLILINLIDELHFRNEILEMIKLRNEKAHIAASKRLGKKFMSSVK